MRVVLEMCAVVAIGLGLALVGNAVHPQGLSLGTDYFLAAQTSAPTPAPASHETSAPTGEAATLERLKADGIQVLSHTDAAAAFDDDMYQQYEAYVFLDARNEEAYLRGHIPGAYHFDPYRPEKYVADLIPICASAQKVVVYCNGGNCTDSELAAKHLLNFQLPRELVFVYAGGMEAWKAAGKPIETGARHAGPLKGEGSGG